LTAKHSCGTCYKICCIDTYIRKISTKNMKLNLYMSEKYIAIDVLSSKSHYLANICMFPKTKHQLYYSTFQICLYFSYHRHILYFMLKLNFSKPIYNSIIKLCHIFGTCFDKIFNDSIYVPIYTSYMFSMSWRQKLKIQFQHEI
jgi:hypothetical protein